MKSFITTFLILTTFAFGKVTDLDVKNFSFAGKVRVFFEKSNLELLNGNFVKSTDANDVSQIATKLKLGGMTLASDVYYDMEKKLLLTIVKVDSKNGELHVFTLDALQQKSNLYNITSIEKNPLQKYHLIRSKARGYSDLLFVVSE